MMTTIVSFIVVLGVLITVHELGHFLVAKALGIGVERFSIGFPPKMFGFTMGETEYCVSWIPLGGYVKLRGEGPEDVVEDADDPRLFRTRPPHQRAGVILAGPIMNLVLAFTLMPLLFVAGIPVPAYLEDEPVVGWVESPSPADRAGITVGDRITAVNGEHVSSWEELERGAALADANEMTVTLDRSGQQLTIPVAREADGATRLGIYPPIAPVVGSLTPGFPARKAGLRRGDHILKMGGVPVSHWAEMASIIQGSAGKEITLEVKRDDDLLTLTVIPRPDEKTGKGLIGIVQETETVVRRFGATEAIRMGFQWNVERLTMTFTFIWDLITFKSSIKNLGGPIMIFQVTGQAAKRGYADFIGFMAFLSLQLGVLNLLPIPVLDGGHLVFLTAEGVMRRPLDLRTQEMAQRLGFILLFLLILVISYNDILRLFTGR